jgi:PTS system ascorbate-specific IIA component
MEKSMFKEENIRTKVQADDWEEAVRIAGGLLKSAGSVTSKYIDAMIDAIHEMGPYVVILPKFALAHAAPSEEVLKDDVALITLKTPVSFGSPNDPVQVIIAFSSKNGKTHLDSLAEIAKFLMKGNIIEELADAESVDEILKITTRYSKAS